MKYGDKFYVIRSRSKKLLLTPDVMMLLQNSALELTDSILTFAGESLTRRKVKELFKRGSGRVRTSYGNYSLWRDFKVDANGLHIGCQIFDLTNTAIIKEWAGVK